ncbi:hypothetical protein Tco_0971504 [Tanacetum coccineum]
MMSSPNHFTSDIKDVFSSMNILNYTSVSSDYFLASSGSISFNSLENSNIIPSVISPFYNNPFYTPTPPQIFEIGKSSIKIHLKHHEEQIEDILNYLDDRMIIRRNDNELKAELKRIRTHVTKLQKKQLGQRDKIAFANFRISNLELIIEEIQARLITIASASNPNRNTRPTGTPIAKMGNYNEFISCQTFYFNGTEGTVDLIRWFERTKSVFSRSNCAEENKVTFATGTLTDDAYPGGIHTLNLLE